MSGKNEPLKLDAYTPYVNRLISGQLVRLPLYAPGSNVVLGGTEYVVGTHQELRRVGPKGSRPARR